MWIWDLEIPILTKAKPLEKKHVGCQFGGLFVLNKKQIVQSTNVDR